MLDGLETPLPGPQTVDLIPVLSNTGTRLTAPSMCCENTSQSRSKSPKEKLSDTCKSEIGHHQGLCPCNSVRTSNATQSTATSLPMGFGGYRTALGEPQQPKLAPLDQSTKTPDDSYSPKARSGQTDSPAELQV